MTTVEIVNGKPAVKVPIELREILGFASNKEHLEIGDTASIQKIIDEKDIMMLAEVTGDINPLHVNDEIAGKSRFNKRIAHGMLGGGIISSVLGTKLPGPGTIYISQTMDFKLPVFIGDTIIATVEITKIHEGKPIVTLNTKCFNQDDKLLLEGEAVVLVEYIV